MYKIETYKEIYYINIKKITYINIYNDDDNLTNLLIKFDNDNYINIDETEIKINKILEIMNEIISNNK